MPALLSETRIILVSPSLPENVGATARCMRHFGMHDLVIAQGGVAPTHPLALRVSAGAEEILTRARCVDSLAQALENVVFAVGTTARIQDAPDMRTREPAGLAQLARDHAPFGPVALVFGTEKHGLSREHLLSCHQLAHIPGTPGTSLNLAMAVNIMAYEWHLAAMQAQDHAHPPLGAVAGEAAAQALEGRLVDTLIALGIWRSQEAASKGHTLRRILGQIRLDGDEVALIQAIARQLGQRLKTASGDRG